VGRPKKFKKAKRKRKIMKIWVTVPSKKIKWTIQMLIDMLRSHMLPENAGGNLELRFRKV
jgi:hypothetical protein